MFWVSYHSDTKIIIIHEESAITIKIKQTVLFLRTLALLSSCVYKVNFLLFEKEKKERRLFVYLSVCLETPSSMCTPGSNAGLVSYGAILPSIPSYRGHVTISLIFRQNSRQKIFEEALPMDNNVFEHLRKDINSILEEKT